MTCKLLTIPECAAALKVGRSTVFEMIKSGDLVPVRLGRLTRIDERDLDDLIERHKAGAVSSDDQPAVTTKEVSL